MKKYGFLNDPKNINCYYFIKVSISPTFFEQLFYMEVFYSACNFFGARKWQAYSYSSLFMLDADT